MDIAKWMIAIVAVCNFGGLMFDGLLLKTAAMHINNPAWPPPATFHNGQTMFLCLLLGRWRLRSCLWCVRSRCRHS